MGRNQTRSLPGGELRFSSTSQYAAHVEGMPRDVRHPEFEQSNSLVILGEHSRGACQSQCSGHDGGGRSASHAFLFPRRDHFNR